MDIQTMQNLTLGMKNLKVEEKTGNEDSNSDAEMLNFLGVQFYRVNDYDRAFDLFRQSAEAGNTAAMVNLGECYCDGEGTEQNILEGVRLFKRAAARGQSKGMNHLAILYYLGEGGLEQSSALAFSWFKKSAETGNSFAMFQVGRMYIDGDGVPENVNEGIAWLKKAADKGEIGAMSLLGVILEKLDDIDLKKVAVNYYIDAAEGGDLTAINNLGCIFYNGMDGIIDVDKPKAKELFKAAAQRAHVPSMSNLAEVLRDLGDETGYRYWYQQAAAKGDKRAQRVVQSWQEDDDGCFITTAVCGSFNKPDDCYELTAFRNFRDGWLLNQPEGEALIAQYYRLAPKIVAQINLRPDASEIYKSIWRDYLQPCLFFIEVGENSQCKEIYSRMVGELQKKFLS